MIRSLALAALLLIAPCLAYAADNFPALTGRVVDEAGVLPPAAKARLTAELAAHEQRTGQQVVVAVVKSLGGQPIEDYGVALGRAWGIGQKGGNTGAILLVSPADRRIRIEVGYGLEGELTDAISATIISQIIIPRFKQGDMAGGIVAGTEQILRTLGDTITATPPPVRVQQRQPEGHGSIGSIILTFAIFGLFMWLARRGGGGGSFFLPMMILSSFGGRGGSSGGSDSGGGGFSGGRRLVRRRRGLRLMVAHSLTAEDRARIAAAVANAEAQTGVEIRLVLAHSSSHYGAFALIYPALLALVAAGAAAAWVSDLAATDLFIGQALLFAAGVAILQSQALRQALAPARVKRKAAWRHARLHYASIGLKQPHTHNLVLVFCSIAERSIEILVDDAIHEKLPEPVWQPIVAAFKTEFAKGRIADAFVNVAGACAAVLAPLFPPEPDRANEIPDELVEI